MPKKRVAYSGISKARPVGLFDRRWEKASRVKGPLKLEMDSVALDGADVLPASTSAVDSISERSSPAISELVAANELEVVTVYDSSADVQPNLTP